VLTELPGPSSWSQGGEAKGEKAQGKVGEKEKGEKYRETRGGEGKTEK